MEPSVITPLASARYMRNNKRGGLKNLRCFPACSHSGHRANGFCGGTVSVSVPAATASTRVWGEFTTVSAAPRLHVGQTIPATQAHVLQRRHDAVKNAWYVGDRAGADSTEFVFDSKKRGWHYGWLSTKHTCADEHVFRFFVCEARGDAYECVAVVETPPFGLYCRPRTSRGDSASKTPSAAASTLMTAPSAASAALKKAEAAKRKSAARRSRKQAVPTPRASTRSSTSRLPPLKIQTTIAARRAPEVFRDALLGSLTPHLLLEQRRFELRRQREAAEGNAHESSSAGSSPPLSTTTTRAASWSESASVTSADSLSDAALPTTDFWTSEAGGETPMQLSSLADLDRFWAVPSTPAKPAPVPAFLPGTLRY